MITTNKIEPKEIVERKKSKVLNTNELEPKQYDFKRREIRGVVKREVRKVEGDMLTLSNYEDRQKEVKSMEKQEAQLEGEIKELEATVENLKKKGRPRKKK